MDRFAFKIDKALRANLYKICRLCGIDNPDQVPILRDIKIDVVDADEEPEISIKIKDLIGFTISKDDKMPQNICTLCVDKINDFYEFRDMCFATNVQTRKLLGLKDEEPKKKIKTDETELIIKEESSTTTPKKTRKRKSDDDTNKIPDKKQTVNESIVKNEKNVTALHKKMKIPKSVVAKKSTNPKATITKEIESESLQLSTSVTPKVEIKEESPSATDVTASKLRHPCTICEERFVTKTKLEQHKRVTHVPNIPRYVCSTCDEIYNRTSEIKTHQLWHKLSRTPYTCALCGESMLSSYVFARHLREHCPQQVSSALLVLDRECPQCHQTFFTNFLYNIHTCAVQTNKCPGCNRKLRNEEEYARHTPICPKVYLTHSKHIKTATGTAESFVRIKNENDVEAAAAAASLGLTFDMMPFVSLTRLPTPIVMSANQCVAIPSENSSTNTVDVEHQQTSTPLNTTKLKKNSKRGVTKEDIKRVDDLIKSTLDALVSIKHEPEVHVDNDAPLLPTNSESNTNTATDNDDNLNDDNMSEYNDFHHNDDGDDDDVTSNVDDSVVTIKEEHISSHIKQEPTESQDLTQSIEKIPVLKLKIRKEHGTLNSSLVDDETFAGKRSEKKKKKKKRKDSDRERDKTTEKEHKSANKSNDNEHNMSEPAVVSMLTIKQEPLDERVNVLTNNEITNFTQPTSTVMTSIPMVQFQISCVSSGVPINDSEMPTNNDEVLAEPKDIKPNRLELDRLLHISNVMEEENEMPKERQDVHADNTQKLSPKVLQKTATVVKATARKSTSATIIALPQITGVSSITAMPSSNEFGLSNVVIKTEPIDSGYVDSMLTDTDNKHSKNKEDDISAEHNRTSVIGDDDENMSNAQVEINSSTASRDIIQHTSNAKRCHEENAKTSEQTEQIKHISHSKDQAENNKNESETSNELSRISCKEADEQAFIKNINFDNLQIKQEKEIDLYDVGDDYTQLTLTNGKVAKKRRFRRNIKQKNEEKLLEVKLPKREATDKEKNMNYEKFEEHNEGEVQAAEQHFDEEEQEDEEEYDSDDEELEEEEEEELGEEEEEREYREMELPPLLSPANNNEIDLISQLSNDNNKNSENLSNNIVTATDISAIANANLIEEDFEQTDRLDENGALDLSKDCGHVQSSVLKKSFCGQINEVTGHMAANSLLAASYGQTMGNDDNTMQLKISFVTAGYQHFDKPIKIEPLDERVVDNKQTELDIVDPSIELGMAESSNTEEAGAIILHETRTRDTISIEPNALGLTISSLVPRTISAENQANTSDKPTLCTSQLPEYATDVLDETLNVMKNNSPITSRTAINKNEENTQSIDSVNKLEIKSNKIQCIDVVASCSRTAKSVLVGDITVYGHVGSIKESELQALPIAEPNVSEKCVVYQSDEDETTINTSNIAAAIEVQQNIVNTVLDMRNVEESANLEMNIASNCITNLDSSANDKTTTQTTMVTNIEEADNLVNENLVAAFEEQQQQQQQQEQLQQPQPQNLSLNNNNNNNFINNLALNNLLLDYNNINEIAENNNNANIERELHDDRHNSEPNDVT